MTRFRYLLGVALFATMPAEAQQFGAHSAIDGDRILISEPFKPNEAATIYAYERRETGWVQAGTMMAPAHDGGDYFGRFIVMDDRSLVIGGTTLDESAGGIWTYRREGDEWEFVELLRPADVEPGNSFGRFGFLYGDHLFVSALGYNDSRGAVWVYQRSDNGAWIEEARLTPADAPESEFFGWSLAFDGERLITGAIQPSRDLQQRGAAYVYHRNGPGDWTQEARISLDEEVSEPGGAWDFPWDGWTATP